jgi:hypothetical protein
MSTVSGAGGSGGLPLEIMQMMDEVSRDLRKDHRDAARTEADRALEQGLNEADEIREQASNMRTGAIVGGALTAAGGIMQAGGGFAGGGGESGTKLGNGLLTGGGNLVKGGDFANQEFQSAAKFDEGDAREASARSQAAGRRAEAEQAEADEAQKQGERARELYSQMLSLEHASMMSALSQKA